MLTVQLRAYELPGLLSRGERAIARLIQSYRTVEEIARERSTSVRTIANQLVTIRRKLGTAGVGSAARRGGRPLRSNRRFWQRVLAGELRIEGFTIRARRLKISAVEMAGAEPPLSSREREVLAMASGGCSSKEIADNLGISPSAIKTYVHRGLFKLGIRERAVLEIFGE